MTNMGLGRWVGLGSMNVRTVGCLQTSTWGSGALGPGQQVVKQLSCPYIQSGLPGGCSLVGTGEGMTLLLPPCLGPWRGGCPLWQADSAVRSPRLTEHSYFPCAADREFTFILVTGLFSFS